MPPPVSPSKAGISPTGSIHVPTGKLLLLARGEREPSRENDERKASPVERRERFMVPINSPDLRLVRGVAALPTGCSCSAHAVGVCGRCNCGAPFAARGDCGALFAARGDCSAPFVCFALLAPALSACSMIAVRAALSAARTLLKRSEAETVAAAVASASTANVDAVVAAGSAASTTDKSSSIGNAFGGGWMRGDERGERSTALLAAALAALRCCTPLLLAALTAFVLVLLQLGAGGGGLPAAGVC